MLAMVGAESDSTSLGIGVSIMRAQMPLIEAQAKESPHFGPTYRFALRSLARGLWAEGEPDQARELLLQSLKDFNSKQFREDVNADIGAIRAVAQPMHRAGHNLFA